MKNNLFPILLIVAVSCAVSLQAQKLTTYVDPFLGTGGHGHVYPCLLYTSDAADE